MRSSPRASTAWQRSGESHLPSTFTAANGRGRLVATLGAKSNTKKVNRKAIQEVDVPKACRTIIDPAAPMALRLQGNLLPEQLILPDDPSFLPEFAMPPLELLAELDLGPPLPPLRVTGDSQSLTPSVSQQDPSTPQGPVGGLILPTSSSVGPGEFMIHGDNGPSSIGGPVGIADEDMIDDPGFTFDENGEFVDLTEAKVNPRTPVGPGGITMPSDAKASARVRQEHEDGLRVINKFGDRMDLDLPVFDNDLPEGEAFPTQPEDQVAQHSEVLEASSSIVAPNRRKKRATRVLPCDVTMELRNKDLAEWNTNYLANMKETSKQKNQYRLAQLAKKNAEYWLWGSGIGGIAARMQGITGPTPFDRFIGDDLFEFFTGVSRKDHMRSKRDRDSGIDEATQEESRRVRQRTDELEEQFGRRQEDEAMFIIDGDEVEVPRKAPSALDNQQIFSDMPWNITASARGSSAVPRSGRVGLIGSTAPPSSIRGSRMVSASPLHGRSQPSRLDALGNLEENEGDYGNLSGDEFGFLGPGNSSDMPEAAVTQPGARVQEALSAEGGNFLTFVANAIHEKRNHIQQNLEPISDILQADAAPATDEVSFDELIPLNESNRAVASQALMMTLTLGTKGLLSVHQDEQFEEITMSLTKKAKSVQVEIENDGQDHMSVEEPEQEEAGHFEEQFAAGREESDGEPTEDGGSLYDD
ncbi:R8 protein [Kalmusia sp. IMI 367209]|nr:R8 protein [Kalmusia sp. IMI 367209]